MTGSTDFTPRLLMKGKERMEVEGVAKAKAKSRACGAAFSLTRCSLTTLT